MPRRPRAGVLALAAVLVLAACNDGGGDGASPTTASTRSTATAVERTTAAPAPATSTTALAGPAPSTSPARPTTVPAPPTTRPSGRTPVPGFGEIAFEVRSADGVTRCGCALLANTPARHARGLMHRRDLSGYDGMLFVFAADTTTRFYMKDTLLPLSIAWFQADGDFVSATDMEPCGTQDPCPTYAAAGPYRLALEVLQGGLPELGVGPGARLLVGRTPCPA